MAERTQKPEQMSTIDLEAHLQDLTVDAGGYDIVEDVPEDGNVHTDEGIDFPFWWQVYDQPWYPASNYRQALIDAIDFLES